jgi:hypothetical protein
MKGTTMKEDNKINRQHVVGWCKNHSGEFDTGTQLAEACADALDLFDDETESIPAYVFDIAKSHYKE